MSKKEIAPKSYLRLFHCLPVSSPIDLYIDNKLQKANLIYEDFTDYNLIMPGEHTLHITLYKQQEILTKKTLFILPSKIYTVVLVPETKQGTGLALYVIEDVIRTIPSNHFLIRFGHFNHALSLLDITLTHETSTFKKVSCYEMTNYQAINPSSYTLQIKDSSTQKVLLTAPKLLLKPSRFYSIYILGNRSKEFPTQMVLSIDGNSYIRF